MRIGAFEAGNDERLFLIAGPCVIESEALAMETAETLARIAERHGVGFVYKSSFDKANRTSHESFRGPGPGGRAADPGAHPRRGLRPRPHRRARGHPRSTRWRRSWTCSRPPAFLCRQTNYIQAVARCGKPVNIKKGQFLAPWDMANVVDKAKATGNPDVMVCERGGVVRIQLPRLGHALAGGDAAHRLPGGVRRHPFGADAGGQGARSGGQREFVPVLARAAVAAGVAGVFMETHPNPDEALSDGPNAWPLGRMEALLECLLAIDEAVKSRPRAEDAPEVGGCSSCLSCSKFRS